MEFYQFHPTGLYGLGILLSEAARGEGGYLLNGDGERFMERYAPKLMELAPRDMVSRAIYLEIRDGRGAGPARTTSTSTSATWAARSSRRSSPTSPTSPASTSASSRSREPVPIQPTAHYAMGGDPDRPPGPGRARRAQHGRRGALSPPASAPASPSTGRTAWARTRSSTCSSSGGGPAARWPPTAAAAPRCRTSPADADEPVRAEIEALRGRPEGESPADLGRSSPTLMMDNVGVFRDRDRCCRPAVAGVTEIKERYAPRPRPGRPGAVFNTDLLEARELGYLLDCAEAMAASALARKESRGAHSPRGLPRARRRQLADPHARLPGARPGPSLRYKPVTITRFEPKPRTY